MQSNDALFNNPLYGSPVTTLEHNPDLSMSTNEAYIESPAHTMKNVNNPLYGDTLSPTHANGGPVYSEPVHKTPEGLPPKGTENYPYSYAIVDQDRRKTLKDSRGPVSQNLSPNYEQASPPLKAGGPQYEEVVFKDGSGTGGDGDSKLDSNGYATPHPVSQSESPQGPLVYHYATGDTAGMTGIKRIPMLAAAVAKSREGPPKKTIYDSQDDTELENGMTVVARNGSKPAPPPRLKPTVPQKPAVYSYAITSSSSSGKRSIKLNHESELSVGNSDSQTVPPYSKLNHESEGDGSSNGQTLPPYSKLEHNMGPDAPGHQVRMAKIEGSGYEPLKREV